MKKTLLTFLAGGLAFCTFPISASAQSTPTTIIGLELLNLQGNHSASTWDRLKGTDVENPGSFPGLGMWEPVTAQSLLGSGPAAALTKISNGAGGGAYFASSSLYYGGFGTSPNTSGGTLAIVGQAIANLQTLAFQIEIGGASGYEFYNNLLPTLTITLADNSTVIVETIPTNPTESIAAEDTGDTFSNPVTGDDEPIYINLYGLQWDLSGYEGISQYSIDFTAVEHSRVYGLRVDQTDYTYGNQYVFVPEPATYALILGTAVLGLVVARRRRAK